MAKGAVGPHSAFAQYIALGDSMSIDRYPSLELLEAVIPFVPPGSDPELPPLRFAGHVAELPVGAASLLFHNDDELWPEFAGRDLSSARRRVRCVNLAEDGAVVADVAARQLQRAGRGSDNGPVLVTLTAGGNDLLAAYAGAHSRTDLDRAAGRIIDSYRALIRAIHDQHSSALVVLTTVYDPSDRTGYIPGFHEGPDRFPLDVLDRFNDAVRDASREYSWASLADAHAWFLGHGARAQEGEGWYWPKSMIEPGARGASELRRLWLAGSGCDRRERAS